MELLYEQQVKDRLTFQPEGKSRWVSKVLLPPDNFSRSMINALVGYLWIKDARDVLLTRERKRNDTERYGNT